MFRFNGTHARELGLRARSVSRPFMPPQKHIYESALDQDGSYDFSEFNSDGRVHFDDRIFEIEIHLPALSMADMQTKLSAVARWLVGGWCDLVFDDMPTTVWEAKLENVDGVTTLLRKIGRAMLHFRVKPFSQSVTPQQHVVFQTMNGTNYVNNNGDWYTKPDIRIAGKPKHFAFNSFVLWLDAEVDGLIIDFKTMTVTDINGGYILDKVVKHSSNLDWSIELHPGVNTVSISSSTFTGSLSGRIQFDRLYFNEAVIEE